MEENKKKLEDYRFKKAENSAQVSKIQIQTAAKVSESHKKRNQDISQRSQGIHAFKNDKRKAEQMLLLGEHSSDDNDKQSNVASPPRTNLLERDYSQFTTSQQETNIKKRDDSEDEYLDEDNIKL